MRIVQIVPRSDPGGGVSGYAAALAGGLARCCGIESDLVAAGSSLDVGRLDASACLLHYVNYAYHPRGCPARLVGELCRWRQGASGPGERRLVTFFHEVYATGPIWRSSFWLSPVQRRLAAALARGSDRVATSLDLYGRMLARFQPRGEVVVTPVLSTVGEPETVPPLAERPPRMLVFGGTGVRGRAYGPAREALAAACHALDIEEILDLGPAREVPAAVDGTPVRALGPLPAAEVSARMLGARAGFLVYPPGFLPKSTVFAAYCAHGLLPVRAGSRRPGGSEAPDPPHWAPAPTSPPTKELQALASAARSWYLQHSIERQAESFRDLLVAGGRP
ncbi:MAG TPA: glycosyltransferase family 1 protein [Thermoanaerobaculia bacterium]|nr:glycosyltransferase family 1 protein [Thermoanaerobaculia bacterium]